MCAINYFWKLKINLLSSSNELTKTAALCGVVWYSLCFCPRPAVFSPFPSSLRFLIQQHLKLLHTLQERVLKLQWQGIMGDVFMKLTSKEVSAELDSKAFCVCVCCVKYLLGRLLLCCLRSIYLLWGKTATLSARSALEKHAPSSNVSRVNV